MTRICALIVATVACSPVGRAQDVCEDMVGWKDIYDYGCGWYEDHNNCENGEELETLETWYGYVASLADQEGVSALQACCVCGRGRTTLTTTTSTTTTTTTAEDVCEDMVGWEDIYDDGCGWYEDRKRCENGEELEPWVVTGLADHEGVSARQACCVCGRGRTTSTTTTSTTTTTATAEDRGAQKSPSSRALVLVLIVMVANLGIGLVNAVVLLCVRLRSVDKKPVRLVSEGNAAVVVGNPEQDDVELGGNPVVIGVTPAMATPTPKQEDKE